MAKLKPWVSLLLAGPALFGSTSSVAVSTVLLLPACSSEDCSEKKCEEILSDGSSLSTNGKSYTKCIDCAGGNCTTVLKDDSDNTFFDCTDEPGKSCIEASVDAQFAYCDVG